jgi:O-antigen ligase
MFQENWLHGVGLDSYGDYFRMYRDTIAANRRGLDVFSNSAHNIFIDLAATGGIVLLLSYLSIVGLVVFSVLRTFKSSTDVSLEFKILVILWIAFNMQTLISINVPSLAIWGWIFSGLILA